MKKFSIYFFPCAFLLILCIPLINSGDWMFQFPREKENRLFHDQLNVNTQEIDSFPGQFDRYYADNFPLRTPLLKIYHKIKFHFFHVAADKENVLIGKNGWYFLGGKDKEIYEGRRHFTPEVLDKYTQLWKKRVDFLNRKKIKTYWLICPNKAEIYPENLPGNIIRTKKDSRVQQLKAHLDKRFPNLVIDPSSFMRSEKRKHKMYYRLDNHWTNRAGNSISRFILQALKKDFPLLTTDYLDQYKWRMMRKKDGIHKKALGITNLDESNEMASAWHVHAKEGDRYGFVAPKDFVYPWKFEMRFVNTHSGNYRILIIRDSFGDALMPFLKEAFAESVFIFDNWEYKLNEEIVNTVKPDIVLFVSLDSHIENFLLN
jgi:alginate O-acetyltransferase complex protein AlgJ